MEAEFVQLEMIVKPEQQDKVIKFIKDNLKMFSNVKHHTIDLLDEVK